MAIADPEDDKAALDAIVFLLIAVQLIGIAVVGVNARNLRLWLRRLIGVRADATVTKIETTNDVRGTTQRPHVRFTTARGDVVDTASVLYRQRCAIAAGDAVGVSYRRLNPRQVAVHGYDFRLRELVGIALGIGIFVVATYTIFYRLHDL
jgi:hypothetical protein